jgi:hypothetical protein
MKLTKEENQELADNVITPILKAIDKSVILGFDTTRLKETLEAMNDQASTLQAFPTEETMNKAKELKSMNDLFEKIIELIELRKDQAVVKAETSKMKSSGTIGAGLLEQMGY